MEGDSVLGLKDSTTDEVRNSVNPRRRLQNRIAQRKFREKAKARKQCLLQSSQMPISMPAGNPTIEAQFDTEHNSHGISLQHSSISEVPIWDQCASTQGMCPDDSSKSDPYPPIDGPYLDGEYCWDLGNPVGAVSILKPYVSNAFQRGRSFVGQKGTHSNNNAELGKPESSNTDEKEQQSEMNAVATIQKQRARLCSEGKQLIELWEELYELAVLLEILPVDSDFVRLLSDVKNQFLLLFQMSAVLAMSKEHISADRHTAYNMLTPTMALEIIASAKETDSAISLPSRTATLQLATLSLAQLKRNSSEQFCLGLFKAVSLIDGIG
ncbi:hypothetical protein BDV40DRAFT_295416 [Aspergillus tamarii]|uniref:BZIP domain-containing protein n=1 Tax=Aspergillus tamarii TaxID=41984 RepID=A0A5N6VD75_ASPTM|nr:hypothetical protein BDV40DRAFT_295416 [Aspergillus tamarii]